MGKVLLTRVVPVDFIENILYFDAIDSFDSEKFIYLKPTKVSYASHQIDFNSDEYINKGNNPLDLLVTQFHLKAKQKKLKFGVPYLWQEDSLGRIKLSDWDKYGVKNLSLNNSNLIMSNKALPTSGGNLIDVGQGLMYIDNSAGIIFDCGGTEPYNRIKSSLVVGVSYTVIISHWHSDHYKYLFDILKDFTVAAVVVPDKILETETSKRLKLTVEASGMMIYHRTGDFNGYSMIKSPSKGKLVSNANSCVLKNNDWILTGDQHTGFIDKMVGDINIKNFQVPHHGSGSHLHDPQKLKVTRMENYFISVGNPSGHRNMPFEPFEDEYRSFTRMTQEE